MITQFFCGQKLIRRPVEFFTLDIFVRKRLDDAHAAQTILDVCVYIPYLFSSEFCRAAHFFVVYECEQAHKRKYREDYQRQRHADRAKNQESARNFKSREIKLFGTVMRKFRYIEQVCRYTRHDLTDLGLVVI